MEALLPSPEQQVRTRPFLPASFLLTALAFGLAACGSSGGGSYTLAPTQKCLDKAGLAATRDKNTVLKGSGGNLHVLFGYGSPEVYVVFGKDAGEATAIENRAVSETERHEGIKRSVILAGVQKLKNVFFYSNFGPLTGIERTKIEACLH